MLQFQKYNRSLYGIVNSYNVAASEWLRPEVFRDKSTPWEEIQTNFICVWTNRFSSRINKQLETNK
jgi:hypothetical protein